MTIFKAVGILFSVIGSIQSVGMIYVLKRAGLRKHPEYALFLFMGVLFMMVGGWMMRL